MSIALVVTDRSLAPLVEALSSALPNVSVSHWPHVEQMQEAEFVVAWRQPENIWHQLPNAKVVCSLGAGVDGFVKDPYFPKQIKLVRIVDNSLSQQMADYVLSIILSQRIQLSRYQKLQTQQSWRPLPRLSGNKVLILGVGKIGKQVAQRLIDNGFAVTGWTRTTRTGLNVDTVSGTEGLTQALPLADYVVSILPSTKETKHIINASVFRQMKSSCCFINVGRGDAVNETELLDALDRKQLASAVLDVVEQEPMAVENPLWQHENVIITPHIAAITDQQEVVAQIIANYRAYKSGEPLINQVDIVKGY